jgi:hypothetical protein
MGIGTQLFLAYLGLCGLVTVLWIVIGIRSKRQKPAPDMNWPDQPIRIIDLHPEDFDRLLTPEEAARRVG